MSKPTKEKTLKRKNCLPSGTCLFELFELVEPNPTYRELVDSSIFVDGDFKPLGTVPNPNLEKPIPSLSISSLFLLSSAFNSFPDVDCVLSLYIRRELKDHLSSDLHFDPV